LLGLYAGARLFVLPSHHEGLPTVLLEAMACRLPVVATACTGSAELVRNGETGLLVPVADPPALAAAVAALWNDRALCRALGAQGREWVAREHTWERVAGRYLACYRDALSGEG
jgi:glycosyltransferase involved in cell wall biosynthesis